MILHFVSTISILAALRNVHAIADGPDVFEPIVDWSCTADEIVVSARDARFAGRLAAVAHPKCSSLPMVSGVSSSSSSLRAGTLRMSLAHPERCGIQYDETSSSWWVLVSVQAHPVLVVDGDRTVNVTCDSLERTVNATEDIREAESAAQMNSEPLRDAVTDAPVDLNVEFRLVKEEEVVEEAIYGHSYSLLLSSASSMRVGDCTAESGSGRERVRLLSGGCPLTPPLITPFTYQDGSLRASIPSMFRFPHSDSVVFECEVLPCQGDKCVPSCDTTDEAVRTLLGVGPTEQPMGAQRVRVEVHLTERRRREEEKSVEQPLVDFKGQREEEEREELPMEQEQNDSPAREQPCADRARQVEEMYLVCVGLSILFAAGCCCNILFCCLLRRGQAKRSSKSIDCESARTGSTTTTTSGGPDFWISDIDKDVHSAPAFFDNHRTSVASFQTGNANRRSFRPSPVYSAPHVPRTSIVASQMSDYGSESHYGRGEMRSEYGRPSDYGVSNSTFLSLSAETDVDSEHSHPQPDNQAISYH